MPEAVDKAAPDEDALPEPMARALADYERHLTSERDLTAHSVRAYLGDVAYADRAAVVREGRGRLDEGTGLVLAENLGQVPPGLR